MITLGPRLVGKAEADKQQRRLSDEQGGGSIQLGERLLKQKHYKGAVPPDPVVVPKAAVPPKAPRVTGNAVPKPKAKEGAEPSAPAVAAYSEAEIELVLATDPNAWDKVCEAETLRPEGWRPAVAHMVLNASVDAKEKPIPDAVIEELKATVARANAEDVAAFTAAQKAGAEAAEAAGPPKP